MDLISQIRALEGPVIDRKRLTSMSSRDVARERNNETFAKQIKKRVGILRNVSIFKEMSDEELAKAAEAFAEVTKECGEAVINQGDIGDEFFIISSGRALVLFHVSDDQPDKVLAKIGANAFFGELALLTDEPRSASIVADPDADGPLELLKMVRGDFQRLFAGSDTLRSANSNLKERRAWEVLSGLGLFASLPEMVVRDVVSAMKIVKYQPGTYIVQQGREGKAFYVILEGIVKVTKNDPDHPCGERPVGELGDHDYFGEVAMLSQDHMRTANVVTITQTVCFSLDRDVFQGTHNAAMGEELRRRRYFAKMSAEGCFSGNADRPLGRMTSTRAGISFKKRLMRIAFRGLMTSLRDSLVARMFQQLCRAPHLTSEYGAISAQAFLSCPDRGGFHRRLRAALDKIRKKPLLARTLPELSLVVGVLSQCKTFSTVYCHDWPHAAKIDFGHHVRVEQVDQGDVIYDSSERATRCYVVVRGTVTVLNGDQGTQQVPDEVEDTPGAGGAPLPKRATFWQIQGDFVEKATPGSTLGLESLDEPADARRVFYRHNAVALTDCVLLVFGYMDYYSIRGQVDAGCVSDVEEKYALLKDMGLMDGVGQEQLYHVAYALKEVHAPRGKTLLREGETAKTLYFLRGGTVTVFAAGIEVNTINKGEYFGESGILSHGAQSGAPPHVESVACVASTPLDLYVMEPINYSLVGARVLGRLRRNWKVRASWRRTRILTQRTNLRLPLLPQATSPGDPTDLPPSPLRKSPLRGQALFPALGVSSSLGSFNLR